MADAKTLMSLSLQDQATKQLKGFESNYRKTMQGIESGGSVGDGVANVVANVGSLEGALSLLGASAPAVAATMAALGGITAAAGLARQAGEVQILRASFDDLASGVGQSSQGMLQAMRTASGGMVADADLIQAANKAMLLGVADSGAELASLLEVARSRGAAMGLSVTQAFSDLVTGLGRGSAEILDNLGITMDTTSVMNTYAASIGTTADKLDGAQRKQALLNEVMRQAAGMEAPIENAATAWQRADAAMQNAKMALGDLFGPAVAAAMNLVAGGATYLTDAMSDLPDTIDEVNNKIGETRSSIRDLSNIKNPSIWSENQLSFLQSQLDLLLEQRQTMQDMAIVAPGPILPLVDTSNLEKQLSLLGEIKAQSERERDAYASPLRVPGPDLEMVRQMDAVIGRTKGEMLALQVVIAGANAQVQAGGYAYEAMTRQVMAAGGSLGELKTAAQVAKLAADQAAMGISGMGRVAAAGAVDVASLEAAVAGLNARMAGMQPILASVTQMRQAAIGQAESLGLQAIAEGADPTQVAGMVAQVTDEIWNMGLSYDATTEAQFMNRVEVTKATDGLTQYVEGLRQANTAASTLAASGLKSMNQELENIKGKVGNVLGESLSLDAIGVNPADALPRADAVQEDAFRLADVMVKGFASPWAAYFETELPALFQEITAGGDIQAGAAKVLQEFQQGLRPELLNFDLIKQKVMDAMRMEDAIAAMRDQITAELTAGGASTEDVQGALNGVLGGMGLDKEAGGDLTSTGSTAGASFAEGFGGAANGGALIAKISAQMVAQVTIFDSAGRQAGTKWGAGFTTVVEQGVGPYLVDMLVRLVTPGVMAQIAAQGTTEGAQ